MASGICAVSSITATRLVPDQNRKRRWIRSRNPAEVACYHGEPYVVAADVSSAFGRIGRSGWTWYTGSAGWMYRIWLEEVLGLRVRGDVLTLEPVIPEEWPGFEIDFHYRSA